MITKKEIKSNMSKIKKLDKAHEVCMLNDELQYSLEEEARQQMFSLMTRVEKRLTQENTSKITMNKLYDYREGLNYSRTIDGVYNGIWASIRLCMIFIECFVLH